jgi:hypothetical protein
MFVLTHNIAGITFQTESDTKITCIQNDLFQKFLTRDSKPAVHQRICGISHDNLTLPPLTEKEKERISQFILFSYIDRSTLTLPPLIGKEKVAITRCLKYPQNYLDIPLLRSPLVRERLECCLSHPKQVSVVLHIFSVVIYDYVNCTVDIFYPSERYEIFKGSWVENGIRRMFTSFLPHFSAVMVHSSCLIRNAKACIFLSPDEGGKSTVLELSTDAIKLCDDRNIIRKEENTFFAYATPWGNITNNHHQVRIGGFFLLEKASDFELIPIKPQDVVRFLWNEHRDFWYILPKTLRIQAFEILCDACFQVPVYKMQFPKDYIDWDAIDKAMKK